MKPDVQPEPPTLAQPREQERLSRRRDNSTRAPVTITGGVRRADNNI